MTTYYEAFDGTKFDNEYECLDYERITTLKEEISDGSTIILDSNFEILNTDKMTFNEIIDKAYYIKTNPNTILFEEIILGEIEFTNDNLFFCYNDNRAEFTDLEKEIKDKKSELAKLGKALNILKNSWE